MKELLFTVCFAAAMGAALGCRAAAPGVATEAFRAVNVPVHDGLEGLSLCIEAVQHRKHPQKYRALVAEAKRLLAAKTATGEPVKTAADLPPAKQAELRALLTRFVPAVENTEKWDPGAYTLARLLEVREARRTAAERNDLWEKYVADCKAKNQQPKSRAEWDEQWPTRILFSQDFEGPPTEANDWEGTVVTDNVPQGSRRALLGATGNKWFARRVRVGIYYNYARTTTSNWVRFKYFTNKPDPIGVFVFDLTLRNNWETRIEKPVVGQWTEVTLDIATFREKASPGRKVRAGDAIDDVFVHAGRPGDKELKLFVDDVKLLGRD